MTATFELTHHLLDKNKQPVKRARLVLSGVPGTLRDPVTNETYAPPPRITTDDDGYLCVADADGVPAATPGVDLVVGVQYRYRPVNRALFDEVVFTAPAAGTTLDYADIPSEPVTLPDTYADDILALEAADAAETARATAAEATKVNSSTYTAGQATQDAALTAHTTRTDNPHAVTKAQVGLGNVDNTSDLNKPVSTATQTAINTAISNLVNGAPGALDTLKELADQLASDESAASALSAALAAHTGNTSNPHSVTKAQVGLGSVDNTSDASKPVSTAQQTALNGKVNKWVASTAYTTGDLVLSPAGQVIQRNSSGTSRASYDATEQAGWTAQTSQPDVFGYNGSAYTAGRIFVGVPDPSTVGTTPQAGDIHFDPTPAATEPLLAVGASKLITGLASPSAWGGGGTTLAPVIQTATTLAMTFARRFPTAPTSLGAYQEYQVYLPAGTYDVQLVFNFGADRGIVKALLGGVSVVTGIDCYAASTSALFDSTRSGVVIPTTGLQTLRLEVTGKNASSSAYALYFTAASITRTA